MDQAIKIVQPVGILDSTKGSQFRQDVSDLVNEGAKIVLVDFQDITFMDSSGLGALVLSLKPVRAPGGKLFICSINEQVRMLFELTSMDRVFQIFANRDDFMDKVGSVS